MRKYNARREAITDGPSAGGRRNSKMSCLDARVLISGEQTRLSSVFNEFPSNSRDILAQPMDYSGCSLQEVAKACLETGTEEAWCEFVRRTQTDLSGTVRRACFRYRLDPYEHSDDLVQGVYLKLVEKPFKLLKRLACLDDKGIILYLRAVATNRTTDLYRRLGKQAENLFSTDSLESLNQELPDNNPIDADRTLMFQKVNQIVSESLSGPNAVRDRAVFWLYFREGLSARQIAAVPGIGLSESDVEVLLRRLIRILRKRLR